MPAHTGHNEAGDLPLYITSWYLVSVCINVLVQWPDYDTYLKLKLQYNSVYLDSLSTAILPDMQKFRITGFFLNGFHWQFEIRLLLFTVRTCI